MRVRKFYDEHEKVLVENSGENRSQPSLSLSVREIFDRWHRGLPLDVIKRDGSFASDRMDDDANFDSFDIDNAEDIVDVYEYAQANKAAEKRIKMAYEAVKKRKGTDTSKSEEKPVETP